MIDIMHEIRSLTTKMHRLFALLMQADIHKLDFEEERKDRTAAHNKLADLERALAQERDHFSFERATYQKRLGEYQQGLKESAASYGELKKQKTKLEKDVEKLQGDVLTCKVDADKLREDMKAKVSQVRQYKKEYDRLKAQVYNLLCYCHCNHYKNLWL